MKFIVDDAIFARYPGAAVGFVVADVAVQAAHPHVEALKGGLAGHLAALGVEASNVASQPDIACWRAVYRDFGVKPSEVRSSLEGLVRRVVKGQGLPAISSVVDLYNGVSVLSMLSAGTADLGPVCKGVVALGDETT